MGERVRFRSDLVAKIMTAVHCPAPIVDRDFAVIAFAVIACAYEKHVTDLESRAVSNSTFRNLVDLTKLVQSHGIYGSAPRRPADLPPLLQELVFYKVSWEYSDRRPGKIRRNVYPMYLNR